MGGHGKENGNRTSGLPQPKDLLPRKPKPPNGSLDTPRWRTKDITPICENPNGYLAKQKMEPESQSGLSSEDEKESQTPDDGDEKGKNKQENAQD